MCHVYGFGRLASLRIPGSVPEPRRWADLYQRAHPACRPPNHTHHQTFFSVQYSAAAARRDCGPACQSRQRTGRLSSGLTALAGPAPVLASLVPRQILGVDASVDGLVEEKKKTSENFSLSVLLSHDEGCRLEEAWTIHLTKSPEDFVLNERRTVPCTKCWVQGREPRAVRACRSAAVVVEPVSRHSLPPKHHYRFGHRALPYPCMLSSSTGGPLRPVETPLFFCDQACSGSPVVCPPRRRYQSQDQGHG